MRAFNSSYKATADLLIQAEKFSLARVKQKLLLEQVYKAKAKVLYMMEKFIVAIVSLQMQRKSDLSKLTFE